jgi:hypothetical protein
MSHCEVKYPTELPVECVRELVRIVRRGEIARERAAFAQHAWNVQGYVQRMVIGEAVSVVGEAMPLPTDERATTELLGLVEESCEDEGVARGLGLPATLLLRWLLSKLIEALGPSKE